MPKQIFNIVSIRGKKTYAVVKSMDKLTGE